MIRRFQQTQWTPKQDLRLSSSSARSEFNHDVFLSFRGADTRKSFTDHLYYALNKKGINTFRDAENLGRGEAIKPRLEKAIEGSKVAVVILSKDYASSDWCLDELAHIIKCKEEKELKVYPVFYDVVPSEVRSQTGNFGDALAHCVATIERNSKVARTEQVASRRQLLVWRKSNSWRSALKEIASLSGWDLNGRLLRKKVLIILDDADQLEQLEALAARRENEQRFKA